MKQEDNLPTGVKPVTSLSSGSRATVLCMGGENPTRHNSLAVFGLVAGAEIILVQQKPSCVLKVGETDLALDPAIARDILVQSAEFEPAIQS